MRPIILDGGLGTELENRGVDVSGNLWSARALVNHQDAIYKLHLDYLKSGADIIITATYQASIRGFIDAGLATTIEEAEKIISESVQLAKSARDAYAQLPAGRECRVAASVGPYGAILGNGAEYSGDYPGVSSADLKSFHLSRISAIVRESPDILALETMPNFEEIKVLIDIVNQYSIPYWVSFSLKGADALADGTPLREAVKYVTSRPFKGARLLAIGANCFPIDNATEVLSSFCVISPSVPLIIYPNSGDRYDATTKTWIKSPTTKSLSSQACTWYANGARYIGGCCRTSPEDIKKLSSVAKTL